jgi:eukaryotic-like serine/threonine-protein kinase
MRRFNILWVIPFLSFISGYFFLNFLHHNKTIKTPSLLGQSVEKALVLLSQQNLNLRIIACKDEPDLPAGTILSQTPSADKSIKEHQALYVVVSQKPCAPLIPNFNTMLGPQVIKIGQSKEFNVRLYPIPMDGIESQCIAQFPEPGVPDNGDKTITVYTIACATKPKVMPNLKNQPLDDVVAFLTLNGIQPTILYDQANNGLLSSHIYVVTDQRPLPGSLLIITPEKPPQIQLQVSVKHFN